MHYVTTGLCAVCYLFCRPFITSFLFILAPDDESKCQDSAEAKSQDVEKTKQQEVEEDNSSDNEEDNTPIAASIGVAPKLKRPATRKRKEKKRQTWTYEPVVEATATYWDGRVEGKRTRTMGTVSYRDDDARSDSEDDPEELFKPQKDDESSTSIQQIMLCRYIIMHMLYISSIVNILTANNAVLGILLCICYTLAA